GPIGLEPTRDDRGAALDGFQLGLESGRLLAIGMAQPPVARRQRKNAPALRAILDAGFARGRAQYLAVALGCDWQPMFEIPGREAAFVGVIAQLDLALFQRFAIGRTDDRQQYAAPRAIGQQLPVDVER